ncbi:MAG: DMT family transporter [Pseudomonadales bacterium]|nr:DMT family transporter [Pseudomonadales bacterium]
MLQNKTTMAVFLAILTTLVGTLAAASAKHLSDSVHPHVMVCTQYIICMFTLSPWILKSGFQSLKTDRVGLHLFRGVSGWACFYTYYYALGKIPLVDASLLRNTAPLIVPFIVMLWLRQRISAGNWLGIIIGFLGIAIILRPGSEGLSLWHLIGFLSGVGLAVSMVTTKELSATESGNLILFYYFAISVLLSLPFAIAHWQPIELTDIPFLLFVGFSIFITMKIYTYAYGLAPTSMLAPFSYFGVIFAGIMGWIFWDHLPDLYSLVGIAMVVMGGITTLLLSGKQRD